MNVEAQVLYGRGLAAGVPHLGVREAGGALRRLPLQRFLAPPNAADEAVARAARGPVLDVGCGPGRLLEALARHGTAALGVDVSPTAVMLARRRGGQALTASVFDGDLPRGFATALLLDGNIGIGGDPAALLARVRELLRHGGHAVVELEGDGVATRRLRVRLEHAGSVSPWFDWARVGLDGVPALAGRTGFAVDDVQGIEDRWFAWLRRA